MNVNTRRRHEPGRLPKQRLSHENLRVYQVAIKFLALTVKLVAKLPRGQSNLAEQLRRAALSIPLNIAEGAGKTSQADSARYFAIARGSALECGAILDACTVMRVIESEDFSDGKELLVAQVAMLTKLCRRPGP